MDHLFGKINLDVCLTTDSKQRPVIDVVANVGHLGKQHRNPNAPLGSLDDLSTNVRIADVRHLDIQRTFGTRDEVQQGRFNLELLLSVDLTVEQEVE